MKDRLVDTSLTRRSLLKAGAALGLSFLPNPVPLAARQIPRTRAIPSSGELVPVVGLGSARTFSVRGSARELGPLREVLRLFHHHGGRVFDTAPTYGGAERVAGRLAQELGIEQDLFFATKVSTGGGARAGQAQEQASRELWNRDVIDLEQVHNLRGVDTHLPLLREAKADGRVRYLGVTTSRIPQHDATEQVLATEELDFVQLNYSLSERQAADRLLPLAEDRGLAVLVNEPYNGGRLFSAVRGREVPAWARAFDCASWGQFFLKYILSHPAVTAVIPATSDPEHLVDNMGAGLGRLPDASERRRIETFFDGL